MTRIFCVIAVLSFGLSTAASAGTREISPLELAAYMLPDGSVPVLCVTVPDGSGTGKLIKLASDTLAMHQAGTLPAPSFGTGIVVRSVFSRWTIPVTAPLRHLLYPPGSGPRAPPAASLTV